MREVRRSHVEPRVSRGYLLKPYYTACIAILPDILEQLLVVRRSFLKWRASASNTSNYLNSNGASLPGFFPL